MRKSALTAAIALLAIYGCNNKSKQQPTPVMEVKTVAAETDSMVYGICGEGTAMNTVELTLTDGKSRSYTLTDGDNSDDVLGGLNVGDSLAVLSRRSVDGMPMADKVVNITSLMARWVSLDQTLALFEGGKATTKTTEAEPVTQWRLCNGKLVIGPDTFGIATLGPDSLYLTHKGKTTGYRRIDPPTPRTGG